MHKNNDKKSSKLASALASGMSLPSDALFGEMRIELRGRNTLTVSGCRRILKYSSEEIKLALKGFEVSVKGCGLLCTTYHYGTVGIEGCIGTIAFDDGE